MKEGSSDYTSPSNVNRDPISNFSYPVFVRKWGNFNWRSVSHKDCWQYLADANSINADLLKDAETKALNNTTLGHRYAEIKAIDEKATSYCNGCTQRGTTTYRVPGTNWWV